MGGHLPQRRHQLHPRPPRPRLVRVGRENLRAQTALQSQLRLLPYPDHGRGPQHDPAVPDADQLGIARGQEEFRYQVRKRNPGQTLSGLSEVPTLPMRKGSADAFWGRVYQLPYVLPTPRRRCPRREAQVEWYQQPERAHRRQPAGDDQEAQAGYRGGGEGKQPEER